MCGIFGYIGPRTNAATIVLESLKTLEYRGYDSWGVAVVPTAMTNDKFQMTNGGQKIVVKKKAGKIGEATVDDLPASSLGFGHTRWATHGGVTDENAHPHLDCTETIAVIHNGIFENYLDFKKKLASSGHRFNSETDTEVIVHLLEEYRRRLSLAESVRKVFRQIDGLNAIIAIDRDTREMIAARNGSPLIIGLGKKENFLASDPAALLPYTKRVCFLADDQMAIITDHAVAIKNINTGKTLPLKTTTLTWSLTQAQKGSYPFFMLKEIHEQPGLIAQIATNAGQQTRKNAAMIKHSYGTYMIGCGTAGYAAIAGAYLFSKIAKRHVNPAIGSEFGYHLDFLTPKSLVIALSQSGETMDILESVKKARARGAKIFALVNVLGSTLYRESDYKMLVGAGPEKSVASTKDFIGKLSHLTILAYALAGKLDDGKRVLVKAAKSAKEVIGKASVDRIKKLAKKIKHVEHMYVIGRGISYVASLETALKLKEISYIHAEGLAAGELKHGTLALVEKGTPCMVFLPDDETYGANLAAAMEVKARGGYIIGVSGKPHDVFDYYLPVADAGEATIIPNVITGQLLAYYLTIARGLDPDMPRNLAKSVTVK